MMTNRKMQKAWIVRDESGDSGATIVWDDDYRRARRLGASELDLCWEDVSCSRYAELDGFEGTDSELIIWQIERGWHFPCNGLKPNDRPCYTMIYELKDGVIVADGVVYCSTECRDAHDAKLAARRADEEKIRVAAQQHWPDGKIGLVYRNVRQEAIVHVQHADGNHVVEFLEGV